MLFLAHPLSLYYGSTMSKLVCKCGNVIVAQTDYLPNKGSIIKEQDEGKGDRRIFNK
jgi:hypothetical protein